MTSQRLGQQFSVFVLGLSLLLIKNVQDFNHLFFGLNDLDLDPFEGRDRREDNRERRVIRRTNSIGSKINYRSIIQKNINKQKNWAAKRIKLSEALRVFKPKKEIVIAVIDTGIDYKNSKITSFLARNNGETGMDKFGRDKRYNGIDDDKNGYVDDHRGWDFANSDNHPQDRHGHGTHIAGIIIEGLRAKQNIKILPLQFFDEKTNSKQSIKSTAQAIRYAVRMGVDIINYSAGGNSSNDLEKAAINYAEENGILVVAAAGNQNSNNDKSPYYPADYRNNNVISVASIDQNDAKVASSNYGINSIDLFAPGKSIQSIGLNNTKVKLTGTSQATAYVTKVAALVLASNNKRISATELKEHLIKHSENSSNLKSYSSNPKIIDASKVLNKTIPNSSNSPIQVSNL